MKTDLKSKMVETVDKVQLFIQDTESKVMTIELWREDEDSPFPIYLSPDRKLLISVSQIFALIVGTLLRCFVMRKLKTHVSTAAGFAYNDIHHFGLQRWYSL